MALTDKKGSSPDQLPSIDEQLQYWDQRWLKTAMPNEWQLKRGDTILNYIRFLPLKYPKILDLGCGTGWFTEKLSHFGTAVGLDLSPAAIELAKYMFPHIKYISGNFYEVNFPSSSFDIIVSQEVIAHVDDQIAHLSLIHNWLKPEGYLIITTANKFVIERMDHRADPKEHIKNWLSIKDLKNLLQSQFNVLRSTSVIPLGNKKILKIVNSYKLNLLLEKLFSRTYLESMKGRAYLGYSLIVLAQKRPE